MKKCPKCELNLIEDNQELCDICIKTILPNPTGKRKSKKENQELGGEVFSIDLGGYGIYLFRRGYGVYTKNATKSTTFSYMMSIMRVGEIEDMDFGEILLNIDCLLKTYGPNGAKRELGEYGHNTTINALARLKEFAEYIDIYMGK